MKNKVILVSVILSAGLVTGAFAAQGRGSGGGAARPASCNLVGPGQGTPLRDGSGQAGSRRGNPNATGTPVKDGSGKATAPGKGAKDGTGNRANCPNPPTG